MNADLSLSIYFAGLFLLAINVLLGILGKYKLNSILGFITLGTLLTGVSLVVVNTGHLPMSGTFEKMQNIALVIVICGLIYELINLKNDKKSFEFWIIALIFQAVALFDVLEADPYFYLYENTWVALFFQFRLISMALIGFAISKYLSALRYTTGGKEKLSMFNIAGNFALLGAIIFLCGEFSGSVWAQIGYGDAWRWSKNFFLSGGMFLLALLVSHLNPAWLKNRNIQIILSLIPLVIIQILFLT